MDAVTRHHRRRQCADLAWYRGAGANRQRFVRPGAFLRGRRLQRRPDRQCLGSYRCGRAGDHRCGMRRPARPCDRPSDRALQWHLLRHADAGAVHGVLRRAGEDHGARRLGWLQRRQADPVRDELYRSTRSRLHAVRRGCHHDRLCRHCCDHPVPLRIRAGQPRGSREQFARRVSRPLGQSHHLDQFRDCGDLRRSQRRLCADGAAAYRSAIRLLDHVG